MATLMFVLLTGGNKIYRSAAYTTDDPGYLSDELEKAAVRLAGSVRDVADFNSWLREFEIDYLHYKGIDSGTSDGGIDVTRNSLNLVYCMDACRGIMCFNSYRFYLRNGLPGSVFCTNRSGAAVAVSRNSSLDYPGEDETWLLPHSAHMQCVIGIPRRNGTLGDEFLQAVLKAEYEERRNE